MTEQNAKYILQSIHNMGGKIEIINAKKNIYRINYKNKSFLISRKFVIRDSIASTGELALNKDVTQQLLILKNINVPKSFFIYDQSNLSKLKTALKKIKPPYVIKPLRGSNSKGVFTNIKNYKEAIKQINNKQTNQKINILIQEQLFGTEYRVLILGNKAIGVLAMIPPYIIGNSKNTVIELITKKQLHTKKKTKLDNHLYSLLKKQNESVNSIPKNNKKIFIKNNSSIAEGGETIDFTKKIHQSFTDICVQAVHTIELSLGGVDIICEDITKDINEQSYGILEVNGKPDIYIHYIPTKGESQDVTQKIIKYITKKI